jgi:hypothetical protein
MLQLEMQARRRLALSNSFELKLILLAVADGDHLIWIQVVFAFLFQTC